MQINFNYSNKIDAKKYEKILKKITVKTFKKLDIKQNFIIDVDLVNDRQIQKINYQYRKVNHPTDVLSFAFLELKENEVKIKSREPQFLGEIIISFDQIKHQAKKFNYSFIYELVYIYLHGLLHLLGYDHVHNKKEKKIMFSLEDELLRGEKYN